MKVNSQVPSLTVQRQPQTEPSGSRALGGASTNLPAGTEEVIRDVTNAALSGQVDRFEPEALLTRGVINTPGLGSNRGSIDIDSPKGDPKVDRDERGGEGDSDEGSGSGGGTNIPPGKPRPGGNDSPYDLGSLWPDGGLGGGLPFPVNPGSAGTLGSGGGGLA